MRRRWRSDLTRVAWLGLAAAAGCGGAPAGDSVVCYCAHDLMFAEPILKEFERRTGVRVQVVGDTEAAKTTGLVNRLIQMKARPEADVFWNNEPMNAVRLGDLGMLVSWTPPSAADLPAAHCDARGAWVGFAARARVILYHRERVKAELAPRSIFDLVKPQW